MTISVEKKYYTVAQRYTNALVEIAQTNNMLGVYETELYEIVNILNTSNELFDFLKNPIVTPDDKKSTISQLFEGKISNEILNLLKVLTEQNRMEVLPAIRETYSIAKDKIENVEHIRVVSAVEIDDELKLKLEDKLNRKYNKKFIPNYEIDKDIIAGLKIYIGDDIFDDSYASKLENMKKQLIRG